MGELVYSLRRLARDMRQKAGLSRWWQGSAKWRDNFRYFSGAFVLGMTRGSNVADNQVRLALLRLSGGRLAAAALFHPDTLRPRTGIRFRYYALRKFRVLVVRGGSGTVDAPAGSLSFLADRAERVLVTMRDFDRELDPDAPPDAVPAALAWERKTVMCMENTAELGDWGVTMALMRANGALRERVGEIRQALAFIRTHQH